MNCKIAYDIISTGSKGNAVVINNSILIDCGVSFKKLSSYLYKFNLVLLTHIHTDHFNKATIRKLASERPMLRFGCGEWLVPELIKCGVSKSNIDVYEFDEIYKYGKFEIIALPLVHNVPNLGYKIHFVDGNKMMYATDTNNLNGITAQDYDLYMIESNYDDEEIQDRIREKEERGEFVYEYGVLKNHLSSGKCEDFIIKNFGDNSEFLRMHMHEKE